VLGQCFTGSTVAPNLARHVSLSLRNLPGFFAYISCAGTLSLLFMPTHDEESLLGKERGMSCSFEEKQTSRAQCGGGAL